LSLEFFARTQPWWWYAMAVPTAFLPWSVLPLAWMNLWHIRREPLDAGFIFCLAWVVLTAVLLSLLPIKQPQYVLPMLPAGALLAARLLMADDLRAVHEDKGFAGMAIPLIVAGGVLTVLPRLPRVDVLPDLLWRQSPWAGVVVMAVGIVAGWLPMKDVRRRVLDLVAINAALVTFVWLGTARLFNTSYPLVEVGRVLAEAQSRGLPIAHAGEYSGEFHFAGRLRAPLSSLESDRIESWAAAHPTGVVVTYANAWQPRVTGPSTLLLQAQYRDSEVQVMSAQDLISIGAVR
jgi:hypothetical protein